MGNTTKHNLQHIEPDFEEDTYVSKTGSFADNCFEEFAQEWIRTGKTQLKLLLSKESTYYYASSLADETHIKVCIHDYRNGIVVYSRLFNKKEAERLRQEQQERKMNPGLPYPKLDNKNTGSKYHRKIKDINGNQIGIVDVYSVLDAFEVKNPGTQHAIKKLLCAGIRGKGSIEQDLTESIDAIKRAITMEKR